MRGCLCVLFPSVFLLLVPSCCVVVWVRFVLDCCFVCCVMGPRCYVFGSDVSCSLFLPTLVSCWFRFALVVVGGYRVVLVSVSR